jgi:hypothetical protein
MSIIGAPVLLAMILNWTILVTIVIRLLLWNRRPAKENWQEVLLRDG